MWKKIDDLDFLLDLNPGTLISPVPEDKNEHYKVLFHSHQQIQLFKVSGIPTLTIFNPGVLLKDSWSVRH